MIFLLEYDRRRGQIVELRIFSDADRRVAEDERLKLELSLNQRGVEREVVLLEASSEEALHRSHRRYFKDLSEIVESSDS